MSESAVDPDEMTRRDGPPPPPSERTMEGERVGRFIILGKLGSGGMAVVYSAYDTDLDRKVAIKVLRGDTFGERQSLGHARMSREAQAMARLSHPNIVQVYEVGSLGGDAIFIAMEFVQGLTLRAWLAQRPRDWHETLAVFLQAGEGLAAAHAAHLVHRDFKPDNVLVGEDGRVRVLDFGLARPHTDERPDLALESGDSGGPETLSASARARDPVLTRAGAYLGTPAYMSPEQHQARPADERSDQFSFCVSLYEGLWGQRPFSGKDRDELRHNVLLGSPRPVPHDRWPRWLRAAVMRGLASDPAERHPSMLALLATLRQGAASRGLRLLVAGLVALVAVILAPAALLRPRPADCRDAAALTDVWDEPRRARVAAAFAATGVVYADETRARVVPALDAHAAAWQAEAVARCEAPRGGATDALRGLCLERRRVELRALTDVLVDADAATVEHAATAIGQLRDPARCSDPSVLAAESAEAPPPNDPALAVTAWALRDRLAGVRFLESAGRYDEALVRLEPLLADAEALAYAPVIAEAHLLRAVLLARTSRYVEADLDLMTAIAGAERSDHHRLRAEALVDRVEIVGHLAARPDAVAAWVGPTEALVHHLAPDSALEGRLFSNIGLMRARQNQLAEALDYQERAVQTLARVHADGHPDLIRARINLGRGLKDRVRLAEALVPLEQARRAAEHDLGPEHPILVDIYRHLASVAPADQQEPLAVRALELARKTLGPEHPSVAAALGDLGGVQRARGRRVEALDTFQRAAEILRRALGDHSNTAMALRNVGITLFELGRYDEAIAAISEVVQISAHVDADPFVGFEAHIVLGDVLRRMGRPQEARAALDRAAAVARDHPELAAGIAAELDVMHLVRARTLLDAGDPRAALDLLATIRTREPPFEFAYASAVWASEPTRRDEALALASAAERRLAADLEAPGSAPAAPDLADLAELRAWLAARREPPR